MSINHNKKIKIKKMQVESQKKRNLLLGAASISAISTLGFPFVSFAKNKPIRVGMQTILSGRVAMLGETSVRAAKLEVDRFNETGGLGGRKIELVIRDTRANPQEAARVAREFITAEDCEILYDAEASSAAFAVHEVARDLNVFVMHTCSETSSLTADPKLQTPLSFRCARQGVHDAVIGGAYASKISKEKKLNSWMTISPDYAYGRATTNEFLEYLQYFNTNIKIVGNAWPKLFQADYSENITRLLQANPQAIYSCLWGGDLISFVDQANIYALFNNRQFFSVNMADYAVLTKVKNVPDGLHSATRYLKSYPKTLENENWGSEFFKRFKELPLNWAWQNAAGINFITTAMKKANSSRGDKIAPVLAGLTINSPFGSKGKLTLRESDHTLIDYAIGWGGLINKEPYLKNVVPGDWNTITKLETQWKKNKGYVKN